MNRARSVDRVMTDARAGSFATRSIKGESKERALLLAMSMLDLTTLEGKDTPEKVRALCRKAVRPAPDDEAVLGFRVPSAAAVCVYPSMVALAKEALAGTVVRVASVATGFPSGQFPIEVRLEDTRRAIEDGADQIDMVINRGAFLAGRLEEVSREIERVAEVCCAKGRAAEQQNSRAADRDPLSADCGVGRLNGGVPPHFSAATSAASASVSAPSAYSAPAHLKVILETGELETYDNIRRASDLAVEVLSGFTERHPGFVGFIKTSTGKVQPAATMPVTLVMLEAVRDEFLRTGRVIGVKPAGGIRAAKQAVQYLVMVRETMGGLKVEEKDTPLHPRKASDTSPRQDGEREEVCPWLTPEYFRFGASTLANDILRQVYRLKTGRYMAGCDFSEA
jgi:deoxyribose-phosphate aldolase